MACIPRLGLGFPFLYSATTYPSNLLGRLAHWGQVMHIYVGNLSLVQMMAYRLIVQATSNYLKKWWPSLHICVTLSQWVNESRTNSSVYIQQTKLFLHQMLKNMIYSTNEDISLLDCIHGEFGRLFKSSFYQLYAGPGEKSTTIQPLIAPHCTIFV